MNPKTVGRTQSGENPQLRAEFTHVGLTAATLILTSNGEVPIDFLSPGDSIVTRNAGMVPLRAIQSGRTSVEAVSISKGALGDMHPAKDVIIPAAHLVLVRDWRAKALYGATQAAMPAGCLIDDHLITSLGPKDMTLVQLGLDAPYVVYADGLELSIPALDATASAAA